MGTRFFDQYSLLHVATGVLAYFWGIGFIISITVHALFEYVENTPEGIRFINEQLSGIWPGGKPRADSTLNMIGDTIFFGIGWASAYALDAYGTAAGWYF